MLQKYRSRYDIIADVLTRCVGEGVNMTQLYYSSSVSYGRLKRLLNEMNEAGLIMVLDGRYSCTTKGARFLALYSEMGMILGNQKTRPQADRSLLNRAREYSLRLKDVDKASGKLLLQGRSRSVLDATAYYVIANSEGRKVTLSDASRVFNVSVNAIGRTKKLLESEFSEPARQNEKADKPPE